MIVKKPYTNKEYADLAVYCNANGLIIEDKGDYLESVAYIPSVEEKQQIVRAVRNQYLEEYVDPKQLVMVWNSLTAEEQEMYKDYRQYLLDYPQTEGWYEQNPDDWETWLLAHKPVTVDNDEKKDYTEEVLTL